MEIKKVIRLLFAIDGIEFGGGRARLCPAHEPSAGGSMRDISAFDEQSGLLRGNYQPGRSCYADGFFIPRINPVLFFKIAGIIRRNEIRVVNGQGGRAGLCFGLPHGWPAA